MSNNESKAYRVNEDFLIDGRDVNFEDINIKFIFGNLLINILYIKMGVVNKTIPEHSHSKKSYEFHYVFNGEGACISNGTQYELSKGMLYMTGPGIKHEQVSSELNPMSEFCICFEMLEGLVEVTDNNDFKAIKNSLLKNYFWIGYDNFNIEILCKQIVFEITSKFIGYQTALRNILEQLLISLARNYLNGEKSKEEFVRKNLDDKRLAIIEESFFGKYKTLTIKSLADELGLSCRQTQRYIKAFYGTNFTSQLISRKLSVAIYLLRKTDMKISEVANEVGFNSLEQFCVSFKKKYGVTATEFRDSSIK